MQTVKRIIQAVAAWLVGTLLAAAAAIGAVVAAGLLEGHELGAAVVIVALALVGVSSWLAGSTLAIVLVADAIYGGAKKPAAAEVEQPRAMRQSDR